jgi:hypothetical protein
MNSQDRLVRTEQLGQKRTVRTGKDSLTGLPGQEARKGQPGQDSRDRTARTG